MANFSAWPLPGPHKPILAIEGFGSSFSCRNSATKSSPDAPPTKNRYGIPSKTSSSTGAPARWAGWNFQRKKAATAAASLIASRP
jgi:hypothetical protein